MEKKKDNRGGFRPGGGRPKSTIARSAFATRLRPEALDRLKAYADKKAMSIQNALEEILLDTCL